MDEINASDLALPVKVVLLGASTVGKTSLVNTAMANEFVEDQQPTIGACFVIKKMDVDGKIVRLHLWDTAGQERFRSLAPMYYRDANFAIICYAINDEASFEAVRGWYDGVLADCQSLPEIYLVANKLDLENERVIQRSDGEALAEKIEAKFMEISAKEGTNVQKLFEEIAKQSILISEGNSTLEMNETKLDSKPGSKKGCC